MRRCALLAAFGLVLWTTAALPQSFPTRPVKMVMTFAAGGPADMFTRVALLH
jgi:tripartite-type tricarboxylate transporter receptor subunit TctC